MALGAIVIVLAVCAVLAFYWRQHIESSAPAVPAAVTKKPPTPAALEQSVRLSAMGDMIAHDTITANAKTPNGYDYTKYFQKIKPLYADADIVFCNQESLSAGEEYGISGYPTFNAPVPYAADLQKVGCNVVNLANNHIADKGQAAIDTTVAEWEKLKPLAYAGANRNLSEQQQVRYFEKNGIKFAFLAFADFSNNKGVSDYGLNIYHDEALVKRLAEQARKNADVVLVSMHWGDEDSHETNQDQQAQVQKLASYGVDTVIGTGPHVLQKAEYQSRPDGGKMLVWYSIGNMLSSQLKLEELTGGVAQMTVRKDGGKISIEKPTFRPTYMAYEWSASQQAAGDTDARKNPMIYPLQDAADVLQSMRMSTTPAAVTQDVQRLLGSEVSVR